MGRTPTAVVAGLALALSVSGCAGSGEQNAAAGPQAPSSGSTPGLNGAEPKGSDDTTSAAARQPAGLEMPSIEFDKSVTPMGLSDEGTINPPAGVVQWYDKSVVPGEKGISVIAGHVEYDGPDVFYDLDELDKGDVVTIAYGDGSTQRFKVYAEESVSKKELQTDGRVWGTSDTPVLALITCDGNSEVVNRHHTDNYVVWAKPV